ncbi:MAG: hypothetical protein ACI8TX_001305 [Hyphomicrobiaceae bacterium]|jgi:hypothetical protein
MPRQCQSIAYRSDHDQLDVARSGHHLYICTPASGKREDLTTNRGLRGGPPDGEYSSAGITGASNFARGPFLVFTTDLDLLRNGSAATNIYRYRIFHPQLNQVVDLADGVVASDPVVSDGGGHVAFRCDGELLVKAKRNVVLPVNADGNQEIFLLRGRRNVSQITQSVGCTNGPPALRSDATRIAFMSDCDLVAGENPTSIPQIFFVEKVFRNDPALQPGGCETSQGCCVGPPDCTGVAIGKTRRARRIKCVDKAKGC